MDRQNPGQPPCPTARPVDWPTTERQCRWALSSPADLSLTQISRAGQTAGRGWKGLVRRTGSPGAGPETAHPTGHRPSFQESLAWQQTVPDSSWGEPKRRAECGQTPIPALSQASQFYRKRLSQDLFMVLYQVPVEMTETRLLPAAFGPPGANPSSATQAIDVPSQGAMTVPTCHRCFLPSPRRGANRSSLSRRPRATPAGRDPNRSARVSCLGLVNRPISSLRQDTQDTWMASAPSPGWARHLDGFDAFPG